MTIPADGKWMPVVRDFLTGKVIRKFLLPRGIHYREHGEICVSESDPKEEQRQVYRFFRESESKPFLTLEPDRQPKSSRFQFGFGNRFFIWSTATGDAFLYDFRKLELQLRERQILTR